MFTLFVTGLDLLSLVAGLEMLAGVVLVVVFVLRLANRRKGFAHRRVHSILLWCRQSINLTEVKAH